ncbi:DUF1302 family protein [Sediminispirochaeta bajacaliforniensis]|uniref:DUF1302 family protein n=1 Tax=Sediminispirochaeta bajacaliforniensis TaxID=148 RepID=UPI00036A2996|nr:DUF1302 family protein [Sediminispirochaeta bajacaliforniensis]
MKKNHIRAAALAAFFCIMLPCPLLYAQLETSGFADSHYAFGTGDDQNLLSAESRLRSEIRLYSGDSSFFASVDGVYDSLAPSESGFTLKELYYEYMSEAFDLRIGRQIIIWGKADGLQITDIVSPKDYTGFVGQEYEDTRLPAEAVKLRILGALSTIETIWIPVYTSSLLPTDPLNPLTSEHPDSIAYQGSALPVSYDFTEKNLPKDFWDSEWAIRGSWYLPCMDLSLSLFHGWEDLPVQERSLTVDGSSGTVEVESRYYQIWMTGLDAAIPVKALVLRTEGALFVGRRFSAAEGFGQSLEKNQIMGLAGVDWIPGNGWSLTAQYMEDWVLDYEDAMDRDRRSSTGTVSISKDLLRETLTLSASLAMGMVYWDSAIELEAEWSLSDALSLRGGIQYYSDGEGGKGDYTAYDDLDCAWIGARCSF